ncbi:MAG: methylenetetrahydrofolate--tRNA-(uracil(54)-C(5))-methyltransferase (FADH(2)-oxidizing) TrmFO [Ruminococcaceae bacterium]|nr:methylenetetrahydrofolate--tRNA-(uracil(54)-C(5))-methyltransferase (FADH(2)-oxidizing) TrmFO [Oscillospiraceae bacterium]
MKKAIVIGAGLAGCEAAWQLAKQNIYVDLYEMKPEKRTPAHKLDTFGELVCSNSLRAEGPENGAGLLKDEMRLLDSVIMRAADRTRVPAGGALAVDRTTFSEAITEQITGCENIHIIHEEVTNIPDADCIVIATGPLTSAPLAEKIAELCGGDELYFYDAAAPIVTAESIDMNKVFRKARYDKGTADYLNCPMNREEYEAFYEALLGAETAELKDFENNRVFEGCMPVEVMAARGKEALTFGPLKPVGLEHPETGERYHAVVQLRQDNAAGTLYNLVGFQTHLKFGEQKRVFSMIPGLENAEFVRYGVMHRNTYLHAPGFLDATYGVIKRPGLYFAGQMTGVEGYVESASSGIVAGLNAARYLQGMPPVIFPSKTATGALSHYISTFAGKNFQPMNINFGIIDSLDERERNKRERYRKISARAMSVMKGIVDEL